MDQSRNPAVPVRFGVFEVDSEAGELRKNGLKVPLQEQPFRVLKLLVEHPGKVITREELQQTLWPADTFVEFDRGLNTAINKVREALGDSATTPRFVETVHRRGYRFLAPVEGRVTEASVRPHTPVRRATWAVGVAGLLVGLATGAILWRHFSSPISSPDPPLRRFSITPEGFLPLPAGCCWGTPAISPNGRYIAYVAHSDSPAERSLGLFDLEKGDSRLLSGTESASWPLWSPGSDYIGFSTGASIKKVPVTGGLPFTLTSGKYSGFSWSPDGREIVAEFGLSSALFSVAAVGGRAKLLLQAPKDWTVNEPRFIPTSAGTNPIVYVLYGWGSGPAELRLLDAGSRDRSLLPPDVSSVYNYHFPAWSPTGHLIYQRQLSDNLSTLWAVRFSTRTLSVVGDPFPIAENAVMPSVSNDGTLVYASPVSPSRKRLVWVDRGGKRSGEIGEPQLDMYLPSLSPNSRTVAVEGTEAATGTDIWLHDTTRAAKTRLTLDPARDSRPFWSPDGKQILFWSMRTGKPRAFIQSVDGSGRVEPVAEEFMGYASDWSPDGSYLLFDPVSPDVRYLHRPPGGQWEQAVLQPPPCFLAKVSPDGHFIVCSGVESSEWEIYVQTFPRLDRKWHVSPGGGTQPRWSRNGKELFYVKGNTLFAVPVSTRPDFTFGTPRKLFSDAALSWMWPLPTYDVAPDGRRFVLIEPVGPIVQPAIWVVQNWFAEFRDRKK